MKNSMFIISLYCMDSLYITITKTASDYHSFAYKIWFSVAGV